MKKILPILSLLIASVLTAATPEEIIAKAEAGNLDAMVYAADKMRHGGKGWPKDSLRADQWAQKAIEKRHIPAVAIFYYRIPEDRREGELRRAAEAGQQVAFAALAETIMEDATSLSARSMKRSEDERSKRAIESYAWAKLAIKSDNFQARARAEQTADAFTKYIGELRYRQSQKKSGSASLGDSPDRVAAKGQDAAKQLAERMAKKFPNGFPAWPPNFDDAPSAKPAK